MAQLFDARNNEYQGSLDGITGLTLTDTRPATQSLAAINAEALVDLNGKAAVAVEVRGTFTATLVFEGSIDGVNYTALSAYAPATASYVTTITTTAQTVIVGVTGYRRFRVRCSAFTSGAAIVALRATQADYAILALPLSTPLHVTATAAVNTSVSLIIPSAGAGLFHYFTRIVIQRWFATVGLAGATPTVVTSTNLVGRALSFPTAGALGTSYTEEIAPALPIRSALAGTPSSFVCPASTDTIWRVAADYYVGP